MIDDGDDQLLARIQEAVTSFDTELGDADKARSPSARYHRLYRASEAFQRARSLLETRVPRDIGALLPPSHRMGVDLARDVVTKREDAATKARTLAHDAKQTRAEAETAATAAPHDKMLAGLLEDARKECSRVETVVETSVQEAAEARHARDETIRHALLAKLGAALVSSLRKHSDDALSSTGSDSFRGALAAAVAVAGLTSLVAIGSALLQRQESQQIGDWQLGAGSSVALGMLLITAVVAWRLSGRT